MMHLGTSVTLELARALKNLPTDTEIRFVTFGAEENGLFGSQHYVENLSDDESSGRLPTSTSIWWEARMPEIWSF